MSKNSKPNNVRTHLSQGLLSTSSGIYRDLAVTNSSKHFKDKHLPENFNDEEPRKTTPLKIELPSYKKHERDSFSDSETDKFLSSSMTYDIPIGSHDNEKTMVENTVKNFPLFKTGKSNDFSFERWPSEKLTKSIESLELTENVNKNSENNFKKDVIADGSKKKKKFLPVQSRYKQLLERKEDASSRTIDISAIYPQNIQTVNNYKKKNCVTSTPFLASSVCNQQYDGSILDQSKFKLDDTAILNQEIVKKISMVKQNKKDNVKGPIKVYKAQRAFEKQEEKVKEQIFTIWAANRKLEKKVEELNLFLETQKLLLSVEQLLNSQISGLKPLASQLSKLNKLASKFSEILEKNSHILPISGISKIKDDELVRAVDESKIYLEELYHMTKVELPQIKDLTKTICTLKNTLDSEIIEQHKSAALLSDCVSLLNHERSLQVQLIQC
nr:uncharacterized protein LOC101240440 isoform X2 [Hydra vulgaris]